MQSVTVRFKRLPIYFSNPASHFAHNLSHGANALRYAPGRSTLLGQADRCIGEFRVRPEKVALAASVEPGGAGQEKDSNLLRV